MWRRLRKSSGLLVIVFLQMGLPSEGQSWSRGDMVLGNPSAPVQIIEYASLSCTSCQHFHLNVLPEVKRRWISTGQVSWVFRDFPLDRQAVVASMLSRCGGDKKRAGLVTFFFKKLPQWLHSQEDKLVQFAVIAGLSKDKVKGCLEDKKLEVSVLQSRLDGVKKYNIRGTPTFVLNGSVIKGSLTIEKLEALIEK